MHPTEPTKHSMKKRCNVHDYSDPSIYMVTVVINERAPLLGSLVSSPTPHIELTPFGEAVAHEEIPKMSKVYPNLTVRRYCIMPDHIHIIIHVHSPFPLRKDGTQGHLGYVVSGFKCGCRKAYRRLCAAQIPQLFEDGYNDRMIIGDRHYATWKKYLEDNPRRLAIKRDHPDYFTVLHELDICGTQCQIIGNRFLLDNPDKMAVIVHRRDTEEEQTEHVRQWLACGERGGVLVSAAIAPREKEVMREAMNRGYSIIFLRQNGFGKLYKPAGESFDACAAGRLLQISPWEHHFEKRKITREECLLLNGLAERMATPLDG